MEASAAGAVVRPPLNRTEGVRPIRFSMPYRVGTEQGYLEEVLASPIWHGDGPFTGRASSWLEGLTGASRALLTTSCTHALEMAAILLDLGPGDEVICPSFTFTSTASAIVINGATPVFADVRPDTLNLDVEAVANAITDRTKAVFVVHYGGVAADIEALIALTAPLGIAVVEDNAHGLGGYWKGQHLGTFGAFGAQSFHDTKNLTCGEGGALLINDAERMDRAEIVREKGTNRAMFLRGHVDRYTWVDVGSSYLPSEFTAAVLTAHAEQFDDIQERRHRIWDAYADGLSGWAADSGVQLMQVPDGCSHPAHVFYLLVPDQQDQGALIDHLGAKEVSAVFHYQPLDSSPAGRRFGRTPEPCSVTADVASRIVRLPLHPGLGPSDVEAVIAAVVDFQPRG